MSSKPAESGNAPALLHGALNLYKPARITSAKALYRVRKLTGVRKSGHAGTLDPAARGVLVICLGKGTKLTEAWMNQPKTYRATARLDVTSESFDADRPLIAVPVQTPPSEESVRVALDRFQGTIEQIPPTVSAVKVAGRRAYRLTRAGRPPELEPRRAHIYRISLMRFDWPQIEFEMVCGRGTYVRAVVRDLGVVLGTGGCLTGLERTAVGPFRADEAWSFESLENAGPERWLVPLERVRELLNTL